jgi:phosphoribosylglycinamide formyltransferase 1
MHKARVAVLISGKGSNLAALIFASRQSQCPYEIVLVGSNKTDAAGLMIAEAEGLPVFAHSHKGLTRHEHDMIMHEAIMKSGADYVVLAGYMRILSTEFVTLWQDRMLNIHPSILPKYKGLDTHEQALALGDSHAGCTVHVVTSELDGGPILGQTQVAILPSDTAETLAARVLIAEHHLYPNVLSAYVERAKGPEYLAQKVREFAMAQPEADEVLSHGMPCFGIIGGKKFAYVANNHHNDGRTCLLVKISGVEEQSMLIESDEDRYYRPPYFGDSWIGIRIDTGDTDWAHIGEWITKSWAIVAPKKLMKMQDVAGEF